MKKAKIMLTSIAILAIVGGALAFKASSKFGTNYCIKTTVGGTGACTVKLDGKEAGATEFYYTALFDGTPCDQVNCGTPSIKLIKE